MEINKIPLHDIVPCLAEQLSMLTLGSEGTMRRRLNARKQAMNNVAFIAFNDSQPIAWATFNIKNGVCHVFVSNDHRCKGVGKTLVNEIILYAKEKQNVSSIKAFPPSSAFDFFYNLGFNKDCIFKNKMQFDLNWHARMTARKPVIDDVVFHNNHV